MAGLAAAWELVRTGAGGRTRPQVVVLEAGGRPGGKVRSAEFCGRTVDLAADAFLARRPEATELCDELGLADALVAPGASRRVAVGAGPAADDARRGQPGGAHPGVAAGPLGHPRPGRARRGPRSTWSCPTAATRRATADRSVGDIVGPGWATRWSSAWSTRWSAGSTPAASTTSAPRPPSRRCWPPTGSPAA